MKLLLIASFADSIVAFRGPLIAELQSRGVEVHVAAPDFLEDGQTFLTLKSQGVRVHMLPMQRNGTNPIDDLLFLLKLIRLIRYIRPNVIAGYTIKPVVYGLLGGWLTNVQKRFALITGLGYAFTDGRNGALSKLIRVLYRLSLCRAHKVFFQNPDDEFLFRKLRILSDRTPSVIVNGSGVDLATYQLHPLPRSGLRFLLIARLLGDKGVREYVQAASIIRAEHPDVGFDLVGWIDSNPDAISQHELDTWIQLGHIHYHGKLSDVRPAIANCSVYVLPSYREGTPRTVLEAMAMGRPIITTDAPGCRETVIDGENGFLVNAKSEVELADAMMRFVINPELREKMGRRSREIAEEKYDVHKVNQIMLREMGIA